MLTAFDEELLVARAARAGAYGYLVKPYRESDLSPAIVTARARFEELRAARSEVATLAEALESRKMVERAKGLLMERDRLTEEEAYTRLRRASQSSGKKIGAVAEMVVLALSGTAKKG
jgi:response regulator NasT